MGTDLGSNWNEVTGDWGTASGRLVEKITTGGGTADAKLICTQPVPERSAGEMAVSITVVDPEVGNIYYLYPCCTSTSAVGTVKVQFEYVDTNEWEITIYLSGVAQNDPPLQMTSNPLAEGEHRLWTCADHDVQMVKAGVTSLGDEDLWLEIDAGTGRYAGLGHNNQPTAPDYGCIMDDFYLTELRAGTLICYDCFCWCLGYAPAKTLLATFESCTDRATCLCDGDGGDPYSFEMEAEWFTNAWAWYGEVVIAATGDGGSQETFQFRLTCDTDDDDVTAWPGKNFLLDFVSSRCCDENTNLCGTYRPIAGDSECSPDFSLRFGYFSLGTNDLNCAVCYQPRNGPTSGTYYITITEA